MQRVLTERAHGPVECGEDRVEVEVVSGPGVHHGGRTRFSHPRPARSGNRVYVMDAVDRPTPSGAEPGEAGSPVPAYRAGNRGGGQQESQSGEPHRAGHERLIPTR